MSWMLKNMFVAVLIAVGVASCEEAVSAEENKAASKQRNGDRKPLILSKPKDYKCLMCKNGKVKEKNKK